MVRKYFRDVRCLTDLVRCCLLFKCIGDVKDALAHILELSLVFGTVIDANKDHHSIQKIFKLCKVKDDFTRDELGFRFVCLNLEVGWTVESESRDELDFVDVKEFGKKNVRTHICEVQLLLRSTYDLKIGGCHDNFVKARNMLAQ